MKLKNVTKNNAHGDVSLYAPAGDMWVFSVYQPNYDPAAVSGLYCNEDLYTFAFWNAVLETWGIFYFVTSALKVLLCHVRINPAPAGTAFHMNVWYIEKCFIICARIHAIFYVHLLTTLAGYPEFFLCVGFCN